MVPGNPGKGALSGVSLYLGWCSARGRMRTSRVPPIHRMFGIIAEAFRTQARKPERTTQKFKSGHKRAPGNAESTHRESNRVGWSAGGGGRRWLLVGRE